MNGEVKRDGSIVFNKHIVYEILSVLIYIFFIASIFYLAFYRNNLYLILFFLLFIFSSAKKIFHILNNLKTQIIIKDQIIQIIKSNGEKIELEPNEIYFYEIEEDERWYRRKGRKFRVMEIKNAEMQNFRFNFNENNFVDYSIHIQNQCKNRFGNKMQVNTGFKEEFGLKEYGFFVTIVFIVWLIYYIFKLYF